MQQAENKNNGEHQPKNFDVAKITARMKGWELKQYSPEEDDWFGLTRSTADKRNLVLNMNPVRGQVELKEFAGTAHSLEFRISCEGIKFVDFTDHDIIFHGNVIYKISFDGQFHFTKLPSPEGDIDITTRNYEFEKPI